MLITADGNHKLKTKGAVSSIKAYGTFGGGSLTLGFKDSVDGTIRAYAENNTAKTAAGEWEISHGTGVDVYVICSGATTPSITVDLVTIA